ncbi:MAG: hypothetical protein WCV84_00865 [Patescibacteria group bacterium]
MAYKMIRCGGAYCLVVAVTPADAKPWAPGVEYFIYANWERRNGVKPRVFHKTTAEEAQSYFSGMADGLGHQRPPSQHFASLDEMVAFIKREEKAYYEALLKEYPLPAKQ